MTLFPLEPLAVAMGESLASLGRLLSISGTTWKQYRDGGVSELVAERLAVRAGLHPYEVWPELAERAIQEAHRTCQAGDCRGRFLPNTGKQKFCCRTCSNRDNLRKRRAEDEALRERNRQYMRDYRDHARHAQAEREARHQIAA